jgi:hypothetical protein
MPSFGKNLDLMFDTRLAGLVKACTEAAAFPAMLAAVLPTPPKKLFTASAGSMLSFLSIGIWLSFLKYLLTKLTG